MILIAPVPGHHHTVTPDDHNGLTVISSALLDNKRSSRTQQAAFSIKHIGLVLYDNVKQEISGLYY